jgi:hypothetical protein
MAARSFTDEPAYTLRHDRGTPPHCAEITESVWMLPARGRDAAVLGGATVDPIERLLAPSARES